MALIFTKEQIQAQKEAHYKKLKKQGENMDLVTYTLRIPRHLSIKFKQKLVTNEKTMREVMLEFIEGYLND